MKCKYYEYLIFSERMMEGVTKVAEDSVHGVVGSLYLMNGEVARMFKPLEVITDKGRLVRVI